jgi:hypothetical protein
MEVHAHTHTARTKWTHYFWEFLMLFLAVFCGFLAEYQLEHTIEHRKEKQYIGSLIQDLKDDTAFIRFLINRNQFGCNKIDSLLHLLKDPNDSVLKEIYYLARAIPFWDPSFKFHQKTFDQLKSSGGLRLIRNKATLDSIAVYYQKIAWMQQGSMAMQFENRHDLYLHMPRLFDMFVFQQMMHSDNPLDPVLPSGVLQLITKDKNVINDVVARYHFMYSTKKVLIKEGTERLNEALFLINHLEKEYY